MKIKERKSGYLSYQGTAFSYAQENPGYNKASKRFDKGRADRNNPKSSHQAGEPRRTEMLERKVGWNFGSDITGSILFRSGVLIEERDAQRCRIPSEQC